MGQLNRTNLEELILIGFAGGPTLHITMFVTLLLVYIVTIAGNIFIIIIICTDYHLHSPMYFFLVCLSLMEIWCISTVVSKLLVFLILNKTTISKAECFVQSYFYFFTSSTDFLLLGVIVMSLDRYLAVCHPLRYNSIMRNSTCIRLMFGCLLAAFLCLLDPTVKLSKIPFCHRVLHHFFCDSTAMLQLICVDTRPFKIASLIASGIILIGPLTLTIISYSFILLTVLKLPSNTGHMKTFSTCTSHLTMVSLVFGSAIFIKIKPNNVYSADTDKLLNLLSTLLAPLLNPFIYTLRNQKARPPHLPLCLCRSSLRVPSLAPHPL
uniref:G-protein coupled receptors family 1 profile domain-containing protein n=1 Tax=Leptobrachium leishanense TaxID=445787 RepID=A0A8C5PAI0_9ANUR